MVHVAVDLHKETWGGLQKAPGAEVSSRRDAKAESRRVKDQTRSNGRHLALYFRDRLRNFAISWYAVD